MVRLAQVCSVFAPLQALHLYVEQPPSLVIITTVSTEDTTVPYFKTGAQGLGIQFIARAHCLASMKP